MQKQALTTKKIMTIMALAIGAVILSLAPDTYATPMLRLTSGLDVKEVTDGLPGDMALGNAGAVVFIGAIGDFSFNVTTGTTKPMIGAADDPRLDLGVSSLVSSGAGTLKIEFSETDFTGPLPQASFLTDVGGTIDTAGNTVRIQSYLDTSNTIYGTGTLIGDTGDLDNSALPGNAFAGADFSGLIPVNSPFSVTLVATITHSGAGQISTFNAEVLPTPEPSTFLMLGMGLVGLVGYRKRQAAKLS